jgi:hypothetical protein
VRQAQYSQDLYEENGSELRRFISLGTWLGLGQTTFDCIEPGREDEAVGQLVALCEHFIRALPTLVE